MVAILRSWIPSVLSLGLGAALLAPWHGIAVAAEHPARTVLGLVAWAIVTHVLPSPIPKYRTPWN